MWKGLLGELWGGRDGMMMMRKEEKLAKIEMMTSSEALDATHRRAQHHTHIYHNHTNT